MADLEKWTDVLGQDIRVGDTVAYASISGRSPQLVIAEVLAIVDTDTRGTPITESHYDYVTRKHTTTPSCKIKVKPILDARGFYRSDDPRPVTLSIPKNIIKVHVTPKSKTEIAQEGVVDLLRSLTDG